jgi:hypothetical protein
MISIDQEKAISVGPGVIEVMKAERTGGLRTDSYDVATGDHETLIRTRPRYVQNRILQSGKTERSTEMPTAESRAAFRLQWQAAQKAADAMVRATETDDRMSLGIAADDLDQSLAKLWAMRDGRDVDWQTILNHMQGLMREFFQEKQAECLTVDQCKAIARLVNDYLGPATKTRDDLNEVLRLIDDADFDPYAAISGDPLDEEKE